MRQNKIFKTIINFFFIKILRWNNMQFCDKHKIIFYKIICLNSFLQL